MKRLFLASLLLLGLSLPAPAQVAPAQYIAAAYAYLNITTDTTTTVHSGNTILGAICINTAAANETIAIYNNTAASGTLLGTITLSSTSGGCFNYNAYLNLGLTIVTGVAAADLTVIWKPAP